MYKAPGFPISGMIGRISREIYTQHINAKTREIEKHEHGWMQNTDIPILQTILEKSYSRLKAYFHQQPHNKKPSYFQSFAFDECKQSGSKHFQYNTLHQRRYVPNQYWRLLAFYTWKYGFGSSKWGLEACSIRSGFWNHSHPKPNHSHLNRTTHI